MLIAKEQVTIRYNSKEFTLQQGEKFDVRDFDVPNHGVVNVEKHIIKKNPGKLELSSAKAEGNEAKEYVKEIKALKNTVAGLFEQVAQLKDANAELVQKHSAMAGEVETAKKDANKMRIDAAKWVEEKKELEKEVEGLRLRVSTKGK